MSENYSHYSPDEQDEVFRNWANSLAETNPKLLEEVVLAIVEEEFPGTTTLDKTE
jgi:hypothetical protein